MRKEYFGRRGKLIEPKSELNKKRAKKIIGGLVFTCLINFFAHFYSAGIGNAQGKSPEEFEEAIHWKGKSRLSQIMNYSFIKTGEPARDLAYLINEKLDRLLYK